MKKICLVFLVCALLFSFAACDRSHLCSLELRCSDAEVLSSFQFSDSDLNRQPLAYASHIDFAERENDPSNANLYTFELASVKKDSCRISLALIDANRYVLDFLRVGIVIDGEVRIYQDYDEDEASASKESNRDPALFFSSDSEIFKELTVDLSREEAKEIAIFVWLEESELYDENGERYKGWEDTSYRASPIVLVLDVNG